MPVIDDKFSGETTLVDLDAHTPDTTGTGWTVLDQTGIRDIRIAGQVGNEFASGEPESSDRTLYTAQGTYPSNDYDVEIDLLSVDTADDLAWLLGRVTDSSNYYAAGFVSTAGTDLYLVKKVAGVVTTLGSADTDGVVNGAVIKLEIRDATKRVFIDNVQKLSDPDDALTSIGEAGVGMGNVRTAGDDLGGAWEMDNFLVTDAGAPPDELIQSRRVAIQP